MGMIICPKCGKKIPDTSRKCSGCGFDGIASYLLNGLKEADNIKRQHEEEQRKKEYEEKIYNEAKARVVTCPYCHSTNTKKISAGHRWLSTGLFGLASSDLGKQWKCMDCESKF